MRGGRKRERLREREIGKERIRVDGGGNGQIGWVWGWSGVECAGGRWQPDRQSVVAASALESLVEHSLRSFVKIRARRCMASDRKGGSVMREGWAEI